MCAVVAIGAASLTLAACGSSNKSSSGSSSTASSGTSNAASGTATSTGSKSPVTIGSIVSLGGPIVNFPDGAAALKAWARGVNSRGGLNGHPVKLSICNDKNDPNLAAKCGRQMVSDHVIAVVGAETTGGTYYLPILTKAKIASFAQTASGPVDFTAPYNYLNDGGGYFAYEPAMAYASKKLNAPVGVVAVDTAQAHQTYGVINNDFKKTGKSFVNGTFVTPTTADLAPALQSIKQGGAKALVMFVGEELAGQVMKQLEDSGTQIQYYLDPYGSAAHHKAIGPKALAKTVFAQWYIPIPVLVQQKNPLGMQMAADLSAEEKSGDADAASGNWDIFTGDYYLAAYSLEQALKGTTGDITAATVIAAMQKAKDIDFQGAAPPWTPTAKAVPSIPSYAQVSNLKYYIYGYTQDGQPKLLLNNPVLVSDALAGNFPAS